MKSKKGMPAAEFMARFSNAGHAYGPQPAPAKQQGPPPECSVDRWNGKEWVTVTLRWNGTAYVERNSTDGGTAA